MADDDQKSERAAEVTGAHGHHHHHEPDGETPSGHVDHDPVCGMVVDPARTAHKAEYEGGRNFFGPAACKAKFDATTKNFLALLAQNGRARDLAAVIAGFERLYAKHAGIVAAEVVSAQPLDAKQLAAIKTALNASLGKAPELTARVDPSILAGLMPALLIAYLIMIAAWPWAALSPLNPIRGLLSFNDFQYHIRTILFGKVYEMADVPRYYVPAYIAIRLPLPPGTLPTLWNAEDRFRKSYLTTFPGYYETGDAGMLDEDGYLYIMARTDDVINVAGHRLSTGAMEEVLSDHPAVAECAVIGVADSLKGQTPLGFLVLKKGMEDQAEAVRKDVVKMVRDRIGPVAAFKEAVVVDRLPKTRSGKILRATMVKIADGEDFRMPATIEDAAVLDEIRTALRGAGYAGG